MISSKIYFLLLGIALVLTLAMLALCAWAFVSLARAVLKDGAAPRRPLPSVALPRQSEPEREETTREWWDDDLDPWAPGFEPMLVNPATGLMMIGGIGGIDVGGNPWGCSWHDD